MRNNRPPRMTISDFGPLMFQRSNLSVENMSQVIDYATNVNKQVNQEELLKDLVLLNALLDRTQAQTGFTNHPSLRSRLAINSEITASEFLDYRTTFSITDEQFDYYLLTQPEYLINTLENFFFKAAETTGGMSYCSLVTGGMFKTVKSLLDGSAMEKLQQLANGAWFDQLLNQAKSAIQNMFANLKQKMEGIVLRVANLQTTVKTRITSFHRKLDKEIVRIGALLSPENMQNMIKRVQDQINGFVDKIKNMNGETIEYLGYMICKSTGPIENQMSSPINALSGKIDGIEASYGRLDSISKSTSHAAVASGAYRIDGTVRDNAVAGAGGGGARPQGNDAANSKLKAGAQAQLVTPITSAEVADVTKWTPPGNGDSRIRFGGGLSEGNMGRAGWEEVDIRLRVVAMRLQKKMGLQLQINSGYRSPAYNAALAKKSTGVAKNSPHMSGLALDITWSTIGSTREKFIEYALAEGIGGIGRYAYRFVHIDLGARRSWNG